MRKLSILFALLSVLTVQCSGYYDHAKWHCGINKLTETISEWLAKPFDYHGKHNSNKMTLKFKETYIANF